MIRLRPATINDLSIIQYWDTQPHVIESDPDDDWNWEMELQRDPPWRTQLIAELDGMPIGFVQIIDPFEEETHYWGPVEKNRRAIDIWIGEENNLGKGFGTKMMQLAINRCFNVSGVVSILIDPLKSNIRAHRFYERLGFRLLEERAFNGTACLVYELRRHTYLH